MQTKIIEACQGPGGPNWGQFLVGRFTGEWKRPSKAPDVPLLSRIGQGFDALLVLDLRTKEGAIFYPSPHSLPRAELEKHRIWVCPLFEPFLEWLYKQDLTELAKLPDYVELPEAPFAMTGYRRPGRG